MSIVLNEPRILVTVGPRISPGSSASGGGTWGSIEGTLSEQEDLQAALDDKISKEGVNTLAPIGGGNAWRIESSNGDIGIQFADDDQDTIVIYSGISSVRVGPEGVQIVGNALDVTGATVFSNPVRFESPLGTAGTAIAFDYPRTYGSVGLPLTGNITLDSTDFRGGVTQLVIHNHSSAPTFPASMKVIGGEYATGEINYILLMSVLSDLILVTISQEL